MLRNILGREVPALAARHAEALLTGALRKAGVRRAELTGWILHAGGRDVLVALRERLGLSEADLRWSAAVLREYGNVGSASVPFTLETALADHAPGRLWVDGLVRHRVRLPWGTVRVTLGRQSLELKTGRQTG